MTPIRNFRFVSLAVVALCGLVACGQADDGETDLLQVEAYLDVADLYRTQGQFRAAVIEAQNALQIAPGYANTRLFISRLYLDIGDNSQSIELLTTLVEERPDNTEAILLLAEAHLNSGNPLETLSYLDNLNPENSEQQNKGDWLRGNAQAATGEPQAAEATFQAILSTNSDYVDALISLSKLDYRGGNIDDSLGYMERAIALEPTDLDLWIWRGQFALLQEQYPEAEEALFEALDIMSVYDLTTAKRFSVLQSVLIPLQMQQKNDQALRYAQIIAESPQGQFQEVYSSAVSFFESGDFAAAEETLNGILASSPDHPGSNILLGMTQYAQGNYAAAADSLVGLANIEGASPQIIKTLAATHLRLNQPDSALTVLTEALSRYPQDASLLAMIGVSQQSMGNMQESVESFTQALDLQPDTAEIHFALAGSNFYLQDFDGAIFNLNETLRINPGFTEAKTTLIDLHLSQQNFDLARAAVQSWLDLDAGSVININLAGRVAFSEGNTAEARQFFDSSLRGNESDVLSRLFLARIDLIDENYLGAQSGFMAVLDYEPSNVEAISGILAMGDMSGTADARIADVQRIIDEDTEGFIPALVLSQYYLGRNELSEAMESAQVAYSRDENRFTENTVIEITLRQANIARQDQDNATASLLVESVLEIQSDNIPAITVAIGIANETGDNAIADAYIAQIKELQPDSSYGFEVEGDLYVARGDLELAASAFERAWGINVTPDIGIKFHRILIALNRDAEVARMLDTWVAALPDGAAVNMLLALGYQENGQDSEAIESYEVAIQQQPDNIVVLNNLAWLYQDSSPARALELSSHAAELYPDNSDVLDTYGWVLFKQNQNSQAIEVLQKALDLAPESEAIADHLNTASQ